MLVPSNWVAQRRGLHSAVLETDSSLRSFTACLRIEILQKETQGSFASRDLIHSVACLEAMASTAYLQSSVSHAAFASSTRQTSGVASSSRNFMMPRVHAPTASSSLRSFEGMRAGSSYSKMSNETSTSFFAQTSSQQRSGRRAAAATGRKNQVVALVTYKVAVLGAAGGIGQPLSLLIKMSPLVSDLNLYDIANVNGVAADLSHCNTPAKVQAFTGKDELAAALKDVDLVIIPAGIPRKPGMTRDDLFNINAGIVRDLTEAVAEHAPKALIHIISNPVNSTVPIAAEVLKQKGAFDAARLMGVTTLDVVRANTFVAQEQKQRLIDVDVPVIGGHAGITILPLLSKVKPKTFFESEEVIDRLTTRIQNAGTEVVEVSPHENMDLLRSGLKKDEQMASSLHSLSWKAGCDDDAAV
jgi:malate dehydrogenase